MYPSRIVSFIVFANIVAKELEALVPTSGTNGPHPDGTPPLTCPFNTYTTTMPLCS